MGFEALHGQQRAARRLTAALRSGRAPHAWLFVGPEGTGRAEAARELARVLLCQNRPQPDRACGECDGCRAMEAGRHPDFNEVGVPEGKQLFPIEAIRQVQDTASLKPAMGGAHVFVVRDAERMTLEAANCFLKTLEEPPPGCAFVLIASSLRDLPETVMSRCWIVRFRNLPPEDLQRRLEAEGLAAEEARWLARRSWGSPGTAKRFHSLGLHELAGKLAEELDALSLEDNFRLSDWLNAAADADASSATEARVALQDMLECVAAYYRDRALRACAEGRPPDAMVTGAWLALDAIEQVAANANRRLCLDHLFTQLAQRTHSAN